MCGGVCFRTGCGVRWKWQVILGLVRQESPSEENSLLFTLASSSDVQLHSDPPWSSAYIHHNRTGFMAWREWKMCQSGAFTGRVWKQHERRIWISSLSVHPFEYSKSAPPLQNPLLTQFTVKKTYRWWGEIFSTQQRSGLCLIWSNGMRRNKASRKWTHRFWFWWNISKTEIKWFSFISRKVSAVLWSKTQPWCNYSIRQHFNCFNLIF